MPRGSSRCYFRESGPVLGVALLLGLGSAGTTAAQGTGALAVKTVHGKVEMINPSVKAVAVIADDGVVIYRERGADKAVTAIAFPGAAATPVYVNTTSQRVTLVSGPMVNGACGQPSAEPLRTTNILSGGQAETTDACWCCAPAGRTCTPANKTGLGRAFLTRCYE
jgi:hypothetical protein